MKSFILSALLVGIVSAQSLAGLPTCAYDCVSNSIPASCNLSPACICNASSFIAGVTCCVTKVCDQADQEATLKYAKGICAPAGVTLTQTAAVCASTASSNGTATGSTTGVPASISSSLSSSLATVSSSLSSAISSVSSAASAAATSKAGAEQMVVQGVNVFAAIVAAAAML